MNFTNRGKSILIAITITALPGCFWGFAQPEPVFEEEEDLEPPAIEAIDLAEWPPLGPDGLVRVTVSDDVELDRLLFEFAERYTVDLDGTSEVITASGRDLGEGFGELGVRVWDTANRTDIAGVRDLLIDLTPPELAVRSASLGHRDGTLELLVQDAWALGSVEVTFQGETVTHDFPNAYPSSIGEAWDQSLVKFPASSLPAGDGPALIVVRDAAGNEHRETIDLVLDALPPQVEITNMNDGDTIEEPFQVSVTASDDYDMEPRVTLFLSGTPVGDLVAGGLIQIDPLDFAAGEHELVASAVDAAGNRGWSQPLIVNL